MQFICKIEINDSTQQLMETQGLPCRKAFFLEIGMALHHAASGDIIELKPLGETLSDAVSTALFKTEELEVIRMVLHTGRDVPEHSVPGEMTIQCLEGRVELTLREGTKTMQAGQLACLKGNEPYSFHAMETSALLLTIRLKDEEANQGVLK
jgi:quercetin dioxygenase-like cupin family protein